MKRNDKYVMDAFYKWQEESMKRFNGIFITHFEFQPQAKDFMLVIKFNIIAENVEKCFFGTPENV